MHVYGKGMVGGSGSHLLTLHWIKEPECDEDEWRQTRTHGCDVQESEADGYKKKRKNQGETLKTKQRGDVKTRQVFIDLMYNKKPLFKYKLKSKLWGNQKYFKRRSLYLLFQQQSPDNVCPHSMEWESTIHPFHNWWASLLFQVMLATQCYNCCFLTFAWCYRVKSVSKKKTYSMSHSMYTVARYPSSCHLTTHQWQPW